MKGVIRDGVDPLLSLIVVSAGGKPVEFTATVDTGFTATLTLPPTAIHDLDLQSDSFAFAALADGSVTRCEVYRAAVIWHGHSMIVDVYETDALPLLGMELMQNCRLTMDIIPDGEFEIVPLKETLE